MLLILGSEEPHSDHMGYSFFTLCFQILGIHGKYIFVADMLCNVDG